MKFLIALSGFLAICAAKPSVVAPVAYNALPLITGNRFSYSTYTAEPYAATTSVVSSVPAVQSYIAPFAYNAPVASFAHPITYSAPLAYGAPVARAIAQIAVPTEKTQYHSQDELGQAAYGHTEAFQSHNAVQDASGNKVGSFSYVAPDGRVLATNYVADALGYRVLSNALPVHQVDQIATVPAVVATDATHIPAAAQATASAQEPAADSPQSDDDSTVVEAPFAPEETPEVAAARAAHLAAHEAVKSRSKRSIVAPLAYAAPLAYTSHYAPLAYTASYTPITRTSSQATVINHGSPAYYVY